MNSLQCFNRYYIWVFLFLFPLSQKGQSLVADIHPGNQGYDPSRLKIANNAFLFIANNPTGGEVLYRSDGTAGKTKAIVGGTQATNGGKIWDFAVFGDDVYCAFYQKKTISIFRTNLSNDSTYLIQSFDTRLKDYEKIWFNFAKLQNGEVYFFFKNELSEPELWKTSGDESSTELVFSFPPGEIKWNTHFAKEYVYAEYSTSKRINQLWRVNLSDRNGKMLYELQKGTLGRAKTIGNKLLFVYNTPLLGSELWVANEENDEVRILKDINPGEESSLPENLTLYNGVLYFFAGQKLPGPQNVDISPERALWMTNGTMEGTKKVASFGPEAYHTSSVLKDDLLFCLVTGGSSVGGLYTIDLKKGFQVKKLKALPFSSSNTILNESGQHVSILLNNKKQLLQSDGTTIGTKLINLDPKIAIYSARYIQELISGEDFYYFREDSTKNSLWKMHLPTGQIQNVMRYVGGFREADQLDLFNWKDKVVFTARNAMIGKSIWIKAKEKTPYPLEGLPVRPQSSALRELVQFDQSLYFFATDPELGIELRKLNPQTGQIQVVPVSCKDCKKISYPNICLITDSTLWFTYSATLGGKPYLFKLDKRTFATEKIGNWDSIFFYFPAKNGNIPYEKASTPRFGNSSVFNISFQAPNYSFLPDSFHYDTHRAGQLYDLDNDKTLLIANRKGTKNYGLFLSDGSSKGSILLKDFAFPNDYGYWLSSSFKLPKIKNDFLLIFNDVQHGRELWKLNENTNSLSLLKDLKPGASSSNFGNFVLYKGKYYFDADHALWTTDGTESGTFKIDSIFPSRRHDRKYEQFEYAFILSDLFVLGKNLYFTFRAESQETDLYCTDATPKGTFLISKNIKFRELTKIGPHLYFIQISPIYGEELWRTDGTPEGTEMIFDLNPGPASSSPRQLTQIGDEVYFSADDGIHGSELFKFKPSEVGTQTPKPYVGKWEKTEQKYILSYQDLKDQKAYSYTLYSSAGEIVEVQPIFEKNKVTIGTQKCTSGTYWLVVSNGKQKWMEAIIVD